LYQKFFILLEMMRNASTLRKSGVKVIGLFKLWNTAANLIRISEKANLRTKMADSIMAVMEKLQLDGLFLQWMWPGGPEVELKFIWQ
jgi:hypothetical protein